MKYEIIQDDNLKLKIKVGDIVYWGADSETLRFVCKIGNGIAIISFDGEIIGTFTNIEDLNNSSSYIKFKGIIKISNE